MPWKPRKPCNQPGCPNLTHGRYCDQHQKEIDQEYDRERGSAAKRGYGRRWRKESKAFLALNPLCRPCEREGDVTAATSVDHIIPHKGDMELFWDQDNWQSICDPCHGEKTAKEDGRWDRRRG